MSKKINMDHTIIVTHDSNENKVYIVKCLKTGGKGALNVISDEHGVCKCCGKLLFQ